MKISDHHVRSPLLNINRACQTCHKWSGGGAAAAGRDDPGADVRAAQRRDGRAGRADRRHQGGEGGGADRARARRAPRDFQRQAQFLLDFVEAENSTGFHAARRRRASWASRSTSRAGDRSRCATCRALALDGPVVPVSDGA